MTVTAQPRPRIPKGDPLFQAPSVAWPTLALFVFAIALWAGAIVGHVAGVLPYWVTLPVQAVAVFISFTVLHDGVHRSLMRGHPRLNDRVADLAGWLLTPLGSCAAFRVAHYAHHRNTNEPHDDPDMWSGVGPRWRLPLQWATADLAYVPVLIRNWSAVKPRDRVAMLTPVIVLGGGYTLSWVLGWGVEATLYWLLPSRLAVLWLAFAFNFLPHHPHDVRQSLNPYAATNIREGGEPWMRWLFLYQNYHLIHHLFPSVPFYRYMRIWQRYGADYRERGAPVVPVLGLVPRTGSS